MFPGIRDSNRQVQRGTGHDRFVLAFSQSHECPQPLCQASPDAESSSKFSTSYRYNHNISSSVEYERVLNMLNVTAPKGSIVIKPLFLVKSSTVKVCCLRPPFGA